MLEIWDRNRAGLESGMLKLRKGIKFPIIPEDFIDDGQKLKDKVCKTRSGPADPILPHDSDSVELRSNSSKRNSKRKC